MTKLSCLPCSQLHWEKCLICILHEAHLIFFRGSSICNCIFDTCIIKKCVSFLVFISIFLLMNQHITCPPEFPVESVKVVLRFLKSCFVFCVCVDMIVFFTVSVTSNTQYDFQNVEVAFVYNFISLFPRILIVSELLSILD